jgi:hypothetical protein
MATTSCAEKNLHRKVRATLEPKHEQTSSRPDRQRHGRCPHRRRTAEDQAGSLRHHGLRCRAAPQLQPHPALAGAGRRNEGSRTSSSTISTGTSDNNIKLHTGKQVKKIDRVKRKVIADDGTEESYDRLLIATGSTPFMLPIPGNDLPGVIGYRDIKDTDEMIEAAKAQARRRHRRRPARPGSRQRPQAARHGCHRGAPRPLAARTPARRSGRQDAAEVAGRQGPQVPAARPRPKR